MRQLGGGKTQTADQKEGGEMFGRAVILFPDGREKFGAVIIKSVEQRRRRSKDQNIVRRLSLADGRERYAADFRW